jgi:hypothetical protein
MARSVNPASSVSKFVKVRFVGKAGETAGLVLTEEQAQQPVAVISRHFPTSEARKMERLERSPAYEAWNDALNHAF